MDTMASQITSLTIHYSTIYSGADKRKCQSSASLAFVRGIHLSPVNFPHKGPVTRKMFPLDDAIMLHPGLGVFGAAESVYITPVECAGFLNLLTRPLVPERQDVLSYDLTAH